MKRKLFLNFRGITLIELLLVTSLIAGISLAIYNSFSAGLRVWHRHQKLIVEEEISIFFDKITHDLRNTYYFSLINAEGTYDKFAFPTILKVRVDKLQKGSKEGEYVDQLGKVEYYYRLFDKTIYRRKSGYADTLNLTYQSGQGQPIVKGVEGLSFRYVYRGDGGETFTDAVLETLPSSIEVTVKFLLNGKRKSIRKFIDLPLSA